MIKIAQLNLMILCEVLAQIYEIQPMKGLETTSPTLTITIIWFCAHVTQTVKRHKIYVYTKCILMVNFEKP